MPKRMKSVFGRIAHSERDVQAGEIDRTVCGMKGHKDGLTCFFNVEP